MTLKERYDKAYANMQSIVAKDNMTDSDRSRFDAAERELAECEMLMTPNSNSTETRGGTVSRGNSRTSYDNPEARMAQKPGDARLRAEDSFAEYARRHGYGENAPTDFDWNAFFARQAGLTRKSRIGALEERTVYGLGEDNTSGGGAASNLVATLWAHDVIDLIRSKTFLFDAGATTVPLKSEVTNFPTWGADVAPSYVSESASLSLDTTPQIGTIQMNCAGAWVDVTGASLNVLDDAVDSINSLIQNSIAKKYSRLIQTVAFYGQAGAATNQAPGLLAESGLMTVSAGTNGAHPTNYSLLSQGAAKVRAQSVEPTAVALNPGLLAELSQLTDTLGQPMRKTPDVENLPVYDSAILNGFTETQGSSNVATSAYVGDFSYCHVGFRLDPPIETRPLSQRYIDNQIFAWMSRLRMSVRWVYPSQTMCRVLGVL